jgi:WD40 repeat protein
MLKLAHAVLLLAWPALHGLVADAPAAAPAVSFSSDVAPILQKKCVSCHGPEKSKGKYRLHTFAELIKPGDSKSAPVTAGQPLQSEIFRRLTAKDEEDRMPQKDDPLPAAQLALIERWITEGARFDGADTSALLAALIPRAAHPEPPAAYRFPVPIRALAFNHDATELAAGGYHEVTVWNPANGALLRRIKGLPQDIYSLAFSPDGALLAAAGGAPGDSGEVTLLDPVKGAILKTFAPLPDVMLALSFSPDGLRLAAGGADNAIHIYAVPGGQEKLLIQQHADWVMGVAFNHDGTQLASASRDRSARIYDARTGELETTYAGHGAPVFGVAFAPDNNSVATCGRDQKIQLWEVKDAKKISEIAGFDGDVFQVIVTKEHIFSSSSDKTVQQHTTDKKPGPVRVFTGHKDFVYALALDERTHRLASGSFDGEVRVWNTEDGALITAFIASPGQGHAEAGAR